jgi:hypothetical protein
MAGARSCEVGATLNDIWCMAYDLRKIFNFCKGNFCKVQNNNMTAV